MKIIPNNKTATSVVVKTLKNGGLVIMPTETVYGAFVDATNPLAVKKLSVYKARPFGKPYSVAVSDIVMAQKYARLNQTAKNLYKTFLPGPVTIVSQGTHKVANGVESETGTLGIRIPDNKLVLKVIKMFGKPITATSANASYKKRPYSIDDILNNISNKQKSMIDLIVDVGEIERNEPSTVIDTTIDDPAVLRQGDIKFGNYNKILSKSPENTMNFAKELWQKYEHLAGSRAIVFALEGEMGTGKTVFVKGLAKALGIKEEIVSPSYDLVKNYESRIMNYELKHIDVWRMIEPTKELRDLQAKQAINDKSIIAIEWADRIADEIRKYSEEAIVVWINIEYSPARSGQANENERTIRWEIV